MNSKVLITFFSGFLFFSGFCIAQKIVWVKQLGGRDAKIQPLGLFEYESDKVILLFKSDKDFRLGRKNYKVEDSSQTKALVFNEAGDFEETTASLDTFIKDIPHTSDNQWILKSKVRNGNYFLAYGLNSPIRLPVGLTWSFAYLDGLGHRLWEFHLPENQQISQLELLPDGRCLMVGYEVSDKGNKNILFSLWDEYGKQVWKKTIGGKSEDMATSACSDQNGNIFVSGVFSPDSTYLGNTSDLSGKEKDGFIACYKQDGQERFFSRQRGNGFNSVEKIKLSTLGKVFFVSIVRGSTWRLNPFGISRLGIQDVVLGCLEPSKEKDLENPLTVYPNPAREVVYFGLEKKFSKGKLKATLHQKDGPTIQTLTIGNEPGSSFKFNVSNLKPGAYYISIAGKGQTISSRVIIE